VQKQRHGQKKWQGCEKRNEDNMWNSGNYPTTELNITKADAESVSGSGQQIHNVVRLLQKKYIQRQIARIDPEMLRKELKEYGAWGKEELENHIDNIERWLWISGNDIVERVYEKKKKRR